MTARIYRPARTAMQSGKAAADRWMLEYEPEMRRSAEPLMGYTSTADMRRQIRLEFASQGQAVAYAEKHGIRYRLFVANEASTKRLSYSDNFNFRRPQAWTH